MTFYLVYFIGCRNDYLYIVKIIFDFYLNKLMFYKLMFFLFNLYYGVEGDKILFFSLRKALF